MENTSIENLEKLIAFIQDVLNKSDIDSDECIKHGLDPQFENIPESEIEKFPEHELYESIKFSDIKVEQELYLNPEANKVNKMQFGNAGIWRSGTKVKVISLNNDEIRVRFPNGNEAIVGAEYLRSTEEPTLDELTGSGEAGAYMTPKAFSGSKKAYDRNKKRFEKWGMKEVEPSKDISKRKMFAPMDKINQTTSLAGGLKKESIQESIRDDVSALKAKLPAWLAQMLVELSYSTNSIDIDDLYYFNPKNNLNQFKKIYSNWVKKADNNEFVKTKDYKDLLSLLKLGINKKWKFDKQMKQFGESTNKEKTFVVFDGTSYYIIPEGELDKKKEKIIGTYYDIDYAQRIADKNNAKINENIKKESINSPTEAELLKWIKTIDDENLLSWCGYKSKKEFEDEADLDYSKKNLLDCNFEDLEYVWLHKNEYGLKESKTMKKSELKQLIKEAISENSDEYINENSFDRFLEYNEATFKWRNKMVNVGKSAVKEIKAAFGDKLTEFKFVERGNSHWILTTGLNEFSDDILKSKIKNSDLISRMFDEINQEYEVKFRLKD